MSAKCSWGRAADVGPQQTESTQPSVDPGRSAQRRFRSSAFPSSLSWDSDSEKETLDGNTWLHICRKPVAHSSRVAQQQMHSQTRRRCKFSQYMLHMIVVHLIVLNVIQSACSQKSHLSLYVT